MRQGAFFTPDQGKAEIDSLIKKLGSAKEWSKRSELLKKGILQGGQLSDFKSGKKVKATIHSKKILDGYTVENVFFESIEGIYVTGNLYKPLNMVGKVPALLAPHGHGNDPRFGEATQYRCAALAHAGMVVFAWDMIGYGDMKQCEHKIPSAFKLQSINSIRALDFIRQLPEVDPKRIGISGESGGGTQTFILTAIDKRIKLSVPVVMVSSYFFGGCVCESGMPIHVRPTHKTNNAEIAACAAPRPQLIISDGDDWTKFTPEIEYPYLKKIYNIAGSENEIENVHFYFEKHDYGPSKRRAAYEFICRRFGLDPNLANEGHVALLKQDQLEVFNLSFPLPENAIIGSEAVEELLKKQ